MITKVSLNGFNGFGCDYDLGQFTLVTGPVGSGKTSICQAVQFVLTPIASANMADVFESHHDRGRAINEFNVELTFDDGRTIERMLKKTEKGVEQRFCWGVKKLSTKEEVELLKEINITIPSIEKFLEMSDAKKIAYLCEKFGDGAEITDLGDRIDSLKTKILSQQKDITNQRGMISRLEAQAKGMDAYSPEALAEVDKQIKDISLQIQEAEEAERKRIAEAAKAERERLQKIKDDELKATFEAQQKAITADRARVEVQKANGERMDTPVVMPHEEVIPAIIEAIVQKEPDELPCVNCLNSLTDVIKTLGEKKKCYHCGTEQMLPAERVTLQFMKREIVKRGGVTCKQ